MSIANYFYKIEIKIVLCACMNCAPRDISGRKYLYCSYVFSTQVCYGYCDNKCKKFLFYILVFLTAGLVLLLLYWKPALDCYLKKSRCALYKADTVLLEVCLHLTLLTADPGVASSIPARSHTFVEIDHEMISTVIFLLPLIQEGLL